VIDRRWWRARVTFPFSTAIVANSLAGLAAYKAPVTKSRHIHNGFDFERISDLPDKVTIKKEYQISEDYVIGMVAAFSNKKDYSTFLTSAKMILSKRRDVCFLLIGDGPNRNKYEQTVSDELRSYIRFLGKMEAVEKLVSIFTVGVLTSNTNGEGISNSIMEYMALSKPVVATDCRGNRELTEDGKTAFLIPEGDAKVLNNYLTLLLDDSILAKKMGDAGKLRLKTEFSLEKLTNRHIELYNEIVDSRIGNN